MEPKGTSPTDVVAHQIVATRAEREACEAELEVLPSWRMRRRAMLQKRLSTARERERTLLAELGGTPKSG
ncbi:MAG TPA: hypothetical protein VGF21_17670 [Thermoleophilaceae bacterium]